MPGFRASMEGFYDAAMAMSRRVLRLLALSLDLPPAWFLDRFQRPLTTLRLLHYSAQPSDPEEVGGGGGAAVTRACAAVWGTRTLLHATLLPATHTCCVAECSPTVFRPSALCVKHSPGQAAGISRHISYHCRFCPFLRLLCACILCPVTFRCPPAFVALTDQ